MDVGAGLAKIKTLLENPPETALEDYRSNPAMMQDWCAKAAAIVSEFDQDVARKIQVTTEFLGLGSMHEQQFRRITGMVRNTVAQLELRQPIDHGAAVGAGQVYDFFRALRGLVSSAEQSLLIVDPWIDADVFDHYIDGVSQSADVRILTRTKQNSVIEARNRFASQCGTHVALRRHPKLHDRHVFVDGLTGYSIGQSLKDAAKDRPTYISPTSPDLVSLKLEFYEDLWAESEEL